MAEGKVVFAISLADLVSAPAKRMQKELAAASKSMLTGAKDSLSLDRSIKSLEAAMVKSAAVGNVAAYQKQARELSMLKVAFDQADHSALELSKELKAQAGEAGEAAARSGELAEKLVAGWEVASELTKKVGESAVELGEFAIEAAQTKQAAESMFAAMAGGTEKGNELFGMVENLATVLPQTKDQLTAWSKEFTAMGVLDTKTLRADLTATASAAALMGDSGAEAFETLSKKITESAATTGKIKLADKQLASLAQTGVNVTDVATHMGMSAKALEQRLKAGAVSANDFGSALNAALISKGAGPLDRMAGSLGSLKDKFREAIGDIFEDVDVSPFTDAVRQVVGLFAQTSASGKVMKGVVGGFFTQFFKWAGQATLAAKHLFLGTMILGLKTYIAIKPWIPLIKMIGEVVLVAGAAFLLSFTPAVLGAVAALGALVVEAAIAAAPFIAIGLAVVGVYEAFKNWDGIKSALGGAVKAVESWALDLGKRLDAFAADLFTRAVGAGGAMVRGLLSGLANKAGELASAVAGLGKKAIGAFKGALGIASPSREFMKLGDFAAKGFTIGVRASNDNVRGAAEGLAVAATDGAARGVSKVPAASSQAPAASVASVKGGGVTVNVAPGAIVINGAQGDASELTEHALSLIFEKVAVTQGVAA